MKGFHTRGNVLGPLHRSVKNHHCEGVVEWSSSLHFPLVPISLHLAPTSPHPRSSFHYFVFQRLMHSGAILITVGKTSSNLQ